MATFSRVGFRRETSSLSFSVPGSSRSVLQLYDHRLADKHANVHIFIDVSWNIFQLILLDTKKIGHMNLNTRISTLVVSIITYYFPNCYHKYFNSFERRKIKCPFRGCNIKKIIKISSSNFKLRSIETYQLIHRWAILSTSR